MCQICGKNPCDSRCPNSDSSYENCCKCGREIHGGEDVLETRRGPVCIDCLDEMSALDVLKLIGYGLSEAEV